MDVEAVAVADGIELPFPSMSFDLLVSKTVIEHMLDPLSFFRGVPSLKAWRRLCLGDFQSQLPADLGFPSDSIDGAQVGLSPSLWKQARF